MIAARRGGYSRFAGDHAQRPARGGRASEASLRILAISNLYPPHYLGGYELLCEQVCRRLSSRGHDLVVLTSTHSTSSLPSAGEAPGVRRVLRLYQPFGEPPRVMRARRWRIGRLNAEVVRQAIARDAPDVVFAWSQLRLTIGATRAAHASGLPVVHAFNDEHIAGYLPAPFGLRPRALAAHLLDRWVVPGITLAGLSFPHAVCVSRALKDALLRRGVPVAGAEVVYQGIPLDRFPLKPAPGAVGSPARLLYVGQLVPSKGVETLIEAVHRLAARGGAPAIRLSIAGDGPEYYTRTLMAAAAAGPARIEWLGKVPHASVPAVYRDHDIFVFPSRGPEAFGLTHLEAMASGTPVVSTTCGGHGELVIDGENALVFERGDADGLGGQVLRLIDDGALSARLAARARAMVERDFTLDRYVARLEDVLLAACASAPAWGRDAERSTP